MAWGRRVDLANQQAAVARLPQDLTPTITRYGVLECAGWKRGTSRPCCSIRQPGAAMPWSSSTCSTPRPLPPTSASSAMECWWCRRRPATKASPRPCRRTSCGAKMSSSTSSAAMRSCASMPSVTAWTGHTKLTDSCRYVYLLTSFRWPLVKRPASQRRARLKARNMARALKRRVPAIAWPTACGQSCRWGCAAAARPQAQCLRAPCMPACASGNRPAGRPHPGCRRRRAAWR